jgi:hypothetical protein
MKFKFKRYFNIFRGYIEGLFITALLGNTIVAAICNKIFDVESGDSLLAVAWVMELMWPFVSFIRIYSLKKREGGDRLGYLMIMRGQTYNIKKDFKTIINDKVIWSEVIFVAIIGFIFSICMSSMGGSIMESIILFIYYFFTYVSLFIGFEVLGTALLHKAWIREDWVF